ncbi:hypothetical protein OWR28_00170 [Chryseobacterium sp. 1B4]
MIKIEELIHAYIHTHCDFEKEIVLTNYFQADWEADILIIDAEGVAMKLKSNFQKVILKMISKNHT